MQKVIIEMSKADADRHLQDGSLEEVVFDRAVNKVKRAGKNAKLRFLFVSFGELHGQKSVVFQYEVKEKDIADEATSAYLALCKASQGKERQ